MIDQVVKSIGAWAIVPAISIALAGYLISRLTDFHRTKSQQRTEFLGIWHGLNKMDDMALEVAIRHLYGAYLPARAIRKICDSDHCADEMFNLAQIWPLLQYDQSSRTLSWKNDKHGSEKALAAGERWCMAGYFMFAAMTLGSFAFTFVAGPKSPLAWILGLNAVLSAALAFKSLDKSGMYALAKKKRETLLPRLGIMEGDQNSMKSGAASDFAHTSTSANRQS